nr:hypothetical protein [Tanacetum cinerariifolium]
MTRSSNKDLIQPFENLERVFRSSRKLFKTRSLDYLSSLEFNFISDLEDQFERKEIEAMVETMEEYICKTRGDYGSGVTRPKIDDKAHFELKGQFLKELRDTTFSDSDHEDANEHIEKTKVDDWEFKGLFSVLLVVNVEEQMWTKVDDWEFKGLFSVLLVVNVEEQMWKDIDKEGKNEDGSDELYDVKTDARYEVVLKVVAEKVDERN